MQSSRNPTRPGQGFHEVAVEQGRQAGTRGMDVLVQPVLIPGPSSKDTVRYNIKGHRGLMPTQQRPVPIIHKILIEYSVLTVSVMISVVLYEATATLGALITRITLNWALLKES